MLPCLRRYQAAGEKLTVENFCLADELAKQKLTLADINEFLTTELKARSLAAAQARCTQKMQREQQQALLDPGHMPWPNACIQTRQQPGVAQLGGCPNSPNSVC